MVSTEPMDSKTMPSTKNSLIPIVFRRGEPYWRHPLFSIQEYRLISIGAFSLALEPCMGAGFVLAALVPPKKEGNAANERHYPAVCYGVFLSTTG